jgi:DhnA family fructose-bisphosphate aldolase class Ia
VIVAEEHCRWTVKTTIRRAVARTSRREISAIATQVGVLSALNGVVENVVGAVIHIVVTDRTDPRKTNVVSIVHVIEGVHHVARDAAANVVIEPHSSA